MAELDFLKKRQPQKGPTLPEIILEGTPLSYGMVVGQARFYNLPQFQEPNKAISQPSRKEDECAKILIALQKLRGSINDILAETAITLTEESLEIFDVYRLLVQDPVFERELLQLIEGGHTAQESVDVISQKFRRTLLNDSFWKTRFYDLQYLLGQLRHYVGDDITEPEPSPSQGPIILVAPYVSPADVLTLYRSHHVVGLVLSDASSTSHTAILARSLHLPTLGGLSLSEDVCPQETRLLIDSFSSKLYIRPSSRTLEQIHRKTQVSIHSVDELPLQSVTKDGIPIHLSLNANTEADFDLLQHPLIKGIGLFRTEILLMSAELAMDFYAQVEEYRRVLDLAGDKPVIFRTLDMADDKDAVQFTQTEEVMKTLPEIQRAPLREERKMGEDLVLESPMGKIILNRYQFLRTQIRALLRARIKSRNPHGPLYIMIPMIADIVEINAYQRIIESEAMREARFLPSLPSQIKLGIMIEVPSLFYQVSKLRSLVDFVSIGTNDLFQYFFAISRWSSQKRRSQDVLSPSFLKFIGSLTHQLFQLGIPVHVCGEMATHPLSAMALLGLGVRHLSIAPSAVPSITHMIQTLNLTLLYPYLRQFRVESLEFSVAAIGKYSSSVDVRHTLQQFAHESGVVI